jgi:hypothetical protein
VGRIPGDPRPRGEPCRRLAEAPGAETAREPVLGVASREGVEAYYQAHGAKDPAYGVAGVAGSDDGPYHREGEQRGQAKDRHV